MQLWATRIYCRASCYFSQLSFYR